MKDFWNERYAEDEFVYGTHPNEWLRTQLEALPPGRLLLPAEGEGRNAVFAARCGWDVLGIDYSASGREKATRLAREAGVEIDYQVADAYTYPYPESAFEAAALIFAHFPTNTRRTLWPKIISALKPGGHLILEVFRKTQIGLTSGGPKTPDLLYNLEEVRDEFPDITWNILEEADVTLDEGPYHRGFARVLRGLGRRTAPATL